MELEDRRKNEECKGKTEFTPGEIEMLKRREPEQESKKLYQDLNDQIQMFLYATFAKNENDFSKCKEMYEQGYGKSDEESMDSLWKSARECFGTEDDMAEISDAVFHEIEEKWMNKKLLDNYNVEQDGRIIPFLVHPPLMRIMEFKEKTGVIPGEIEMLRHPEPEQENEEAYKKLKIRIQTFVNSILAENGNDFNRYKKIYKECYGGADEKSMDLLRARSRNGGCRFVAEISEAVLHEIEEELRNRKPLDKYKIERDSKVIPFLVKFPLKRIMSRDNRKLIVAGSSAADALQEIHSEEYIESQWLRGSGKTGKELIEEYNLLLQLDLYGKIFRDLILIESDPKKGNIFYYAGAELFPRCDWENARMEKLLSEMQNIMEESVSREKDPSVNAKKILEKKHNDHRPKILKKIEKAINSLKKTREMEKREKTVKNIHSRTGRVDKLFVQYFLQPIPEEAISEMFPEMGMRDIYYECLYKKNLSPRSPILKLLEGFDRLCVPDENETTEEHTSNGKEEDAFYERTIEHTE